MKPFLLVNSNVVRPPVSPVGLEYVGESLRQAGAAVEVVDLAFEADAPTALRRALAYTQPVAVGVAVRNTDDCSFATRHSFLPYIRELTAEIHRLTEAPVVLGGVGFSVAPRAILEFTGADMGIDGDGEAAALSLYRCLSRGEDPSSVPGLVYRRGGRVRHTPRSPADLHALPPPTRTLMDNPRYQQEGGMVGVETKRGCPRRCIYCADPVAKGRKLRLRPPATVAEEIRGLAAQGVRWLHLGDSEFNLSLGHAKEVCRRLIAAGLGEGVRWYGYCSPLPFDRELAGLMRASGCAGINFGVDALCDPQLARLGREHRCADLHHLVSLLRESGLNFMFDLLLGAPGETEATIAETLAGAQRLELPLVGVAVGVRVYPGTPLSRQLAGLRDGLHPGQGPGLHLPAFYLSPALGEDAFGLVRQLSAGDERFLLLGAPAQPGSYNYAGDAWLNQAIARGARGAYWDMIRRKGEP